MLSWTPTWLRQTPTAWSDAETEGPHAATQHAAVPPDAVRHVVTLPNWRGAPDMKMLGHLWILHRSSSDARGHFYHSVSLLFLFFFSSLN